MVDIIYLLRYLLQVNLPFIVSMVLWPLIFDFLVVECVSMNIFVDDWSLVVVFELLHHHCRHLMYYHSFQWQSHRSRHTIFHDYHVVPCRRSDPHRRP